ncbi:sigma-70 family RNA polymerase sigma factor [Flavobacteriaceae bacterium F08102]|nr:sigma-70 family RNA polymerase sigma factor [Flavobacteriaceae bacterium F08102]
MNNKERILDLAKAIKKGDQKAFKVIHDLNYVKLTAYINGFTKNEFETEDILQETFIKLWNSRDKIDVIKNINSYLYKTAYYTYIDKYRKEKKELSTLDSWKYKRLIEAIEEDDEINKKRIKKLKLAIEKLPARCKEVFILCKYENLTYKQIANRLEISPKTVQAQMGKAYSIIREKFRDNIFLTLFFYFMGRANYKVQKLTQKSL